MEKILSVSIAAYNVEKYIEETLKCFVNVRGSERLDVMIIDDGSTDNTPNIVELYVEKYPNIFRIIKKRNGGWGSTVNIGIKNAQGKYFKLLDGDDYFVSDHIAGFLDALEHLESDIVLTPSYAFDDSTKRRLYNIEDFVLPTNYRSYDIDKLNMYLFNPSVYGVCFKSKILKNNDINITENCFYTDVEYVLKGCNCAFSITTLPMELYCYRKARSGQSMSLAGVRKHYMEHYKMLINMLEYDKNVVERESMHIVFNSRLMNVAANMYKWFLFQEINDEHKEQLVRFDNILKKKYPNIYNSNVSKIVGLLRRSNFKLYNILAWYQLEQDKRKHIDIFQ